MKTYASFPVTRPYPFSSFVAPVYAREYKRPTAQFPATNILRNENGFVIEMAVPGLTREQLTIQIDNEQLVISATANSDAPKPSFVRQEFDYTNFKRVFRLHKNANVEAMTATVNNGVLTITVPDKEPAVRKIDIQ